MKFTLTFSAVAAMATFSRAASFTNSVLVDAFVRANAPAANYGLAGALSVSGATATNATGVANGIADTFIRFNTAGMVTSFNSLFGPNNWVISRATLRVTEVGAPPNAIFNRGKGVFGIRWVANDAWVEGTGMPMAPTADGIVYNDEPTLLTNTVSLGSFTNAGINSTDSFSLALPASFTSNISAGGDVGLYLTAIDPGTGFTFNSHDFGTATQRPFLEISAVPLPGITSVTFSGTDVVLSATNGTAGETCVIFSSTNLLAPAAQWTPVTTNVLSANGPFAVTATNALSNTSAQQFFILQIQ
jgi:hypothetical protein